eukprot:gene33677-21484_t
MDAPLPGSSRQLKVKRKSVCSERLDENEIDSFSAPKEGDEGDDKWYIEGGVARLVKGSSFGEMQLLHFCPMQSSVTALTDVQPQHGPPRFLSCASWLKGMSDVERLQLADALKSVKSADGECIIKYGDEGHWFHIIEEGTVEVIGQKEGAAPFKVCEFHEGDCVGELEFIHNHKCVADVRCVGEVRSAKMSRRHFEMCMGPVLDILRRTAAESTVQSQSQDRRASQDRHRDTDVPAYRLHDVSHVPITERELRSEFAKLDTEGRGFIPKARMADYYHSLEMFGICETIEESGQMEYFGNYGDSISFDEFAVIVLRLSQR